MNSRKATPIPTTRKKASGVETALFLLMSVDLEEQQ